MKEYYLTYEVKQDEFADKDIVFTGSMLCENLLIKLGTEYSISKALPENDIVDLLKKHPYYFADILAIDGEIIKIRFSIIEFK